MTTDNKTTSVRPRGITGITCCKDCTRRHPSCHSHCDNYITERALLDKYKADTRRENQAEIYNKIVSMRMRDYYSKKQPRYR